MANGANHREENACLTVRDELFVEAAHSLGLTPGEVIERFKDRFSTSLAGARENARGCRGGEDNSTDYARGMVIEFELMLGLRETDWYIPKTDR